MKKIFSFIILLLTLISFTNALDWTDLEAYYDFDGGSLVDLTGNGHDAINTGATATAGIIGGAYDFESSESDWMNIGTGFDFSGTQPFTFNAWVNTESATGEILSYNPSTTNYFKIQLATGHYYFQRANQYIDTVTTVTTGSWEMLTIVYDGSTIKGYRNATLSGSIASSTSYTGGTNLFNIGRRPTGVAYYDGIIDEISIWYRNLSSTEVSELYNGGSGLQYTISTPATLIVNITSIKANGDLFVNNTVFEVNDITFNVTYEVNNSDIGNFTNSSITTFNDLANGIYYIQFEVCYNTTCDTSGNYTYTINKTTAILFDSIKFNGAEFNTGDWFDIDNIILNVTLQNISTNSNIDTNYTLYKFTGTGYSQIDSRYFSYNSLTGGINISPYLTGDGNYSIQLYAENNETTKTSSYLYFKIDTINPIISHNIPLEINSYNLAGIQINITELNLDTCIINIDSTNYNCSSFTGHTFTTNGYKGWTITTTDLAGNQDIETGTLLVNPIQLFNIYDIIRHSFVSSFMLGSYSTSTTSLGIPLYDLGLGNHTLQFYKVGFQKTNFTFNFNTTSNLNQTFNVSPALLTVLVKDEVTNTYLSNFDAIIYNSTVSYQYNNVSSLTLYKDNASTTPLGQATIYISADNYTGRNYVLTLETTTVTELTAYLRPSNTGQYVSFIIYDNKNTLIKNALIQIYQKINNTDVVIEQVLTDDAGYGGVYIDPTVANQWFIVFKDGYVQQQFSIRASTLEYQVYLKPLTDLWLTWNKDVSYTLTPVNTILTDEMLNLTWSLVNANNDFTLWGVTIENSTDIIQTYTSNANSGGTFNYYDTGNNSLIKASFFYQIGTKRYDFKKVYHMHYTNINYSSINALKLGRDFAQTDEMPYIAKVFICLFILISAMAVTEKFPKGEGKGTFIGMAILAFYGVIGIFHWGLVAVTLIGVGLINYDRKDKGVLG